MNHKYTEERISYIKTQILSLCEKLNLPPHMKQESVDLFNKMEGVSGQGLDVLHAAIVYTICRANNSSRTLTEIAVHSHLLRRDIGRFYRKIITSGIILVSPPCPLNYLTRISNDIHVSLKTEKRAKELIDIINSCNTLACSPEYVATTALYLACIENGENKTMKFISDKSGTPTSSIRNISRRIEAII